MSDVIRISDDRFKGILRSKLTLLVEKIKMKKLFFVSLYFFFACVPQTKITATWKKSSVETGIYQSMLVMSLNSETPVRSVIEKNVSSELVKAGTVNFVSIEEFPPAFGRDSITRVELNQKIREKNIAAIITVSAIKKESDSRYISGNCEYNPNVYYFNGRFWGYYHYWYPCVYQQGYYVNSDRYFIETNVYNAQTEELVWSAQSVTYNPSELNSFSVSYAKMIVSKLRADGIIK